MPVLFFAQNVARPAYFEVAHGYAIPAAQFGIFGERGKPFIRRVGKHFLRSVSKIRARHSIASAHSAFQLI